MRDRPPATLCVALRAGLMTYMYYTYVLKLSNNDLYIGSTTDLDTRLQQHQHAKVRATKPYLPIKLVYYEACLDHEKAISREKQLKTGFGRAYLKRRLT
ncbi:MAG: GIY-YIG nuclease family protein [bacterium]|nr:GIY-YIG nuclease family protein [bacterium]RIK50806.1 MAG: excinuclease ABC subunit C [Candidatus Microgenomates bacterium]